MVNSEPVKPAFDTHASSLKNDNLEALLDWPAPGLDDTRLS
jgi:hypothetical protein